MRVGVVGAGITGLSLVHHLRERTVDVAALEAAEEPGGVIESGEVDGRLLEWGPQRTRLTPAIEGLVDDLGLHEALVEADPTLPLYVYADGRLRRVPKSIRTLLATDLLSWRGKLRLLAEPFTAAGSEAETAAALFTRKFGTEAYENVVAPLFGGVYASDPAAMPAGYAARPLLQLEAREGSLLKPAVKRALKGGETPPISFDVGLQQLPEALYDAHEEAVHLGRPVEAVEAASDGYRLVTTDGMEIVDRVVVTTPADATADLFADLAPDAAGRLRELNYNPLALVHLRASADRDGFGYQVRGDEDLRTLGVTWNASLFGPGGSGDGTGDGDGDGDGNGTGDGAENRADVYTCFLGGMHDPEVLDEADGAIGEIAAREFEQVMDAEADVLAVTRLERGFPAWDTSWRALDGLEAPDGVYLATNYTDRMGIPSRVSQAERLAGQFAREESSGDDRPPSRS